MVADVQESNSETIKAEGAMAPTEAKTFHSLKVLVFKLNGQEYGIDAFYVRKINHLTKITYVPNLPTFLVGVINLRGRIVPVIDLHCRFNIAVGEAPQFVVVVLMNGKEIGLLVNQASEVRHIIPADIFPPPSEAIGVDVDYIDGIIQLEDKERKRMIILLNLERVLHKTW